MSYDPELAKRVQEENGGMVKNHDQNRRVAMKQDLGFSDSEEESYCSDENESKERCVLKEEFEQLQQRYMAALKDTQAIGDKERKAHEQLAKLRHMSKSQVTILNRNFKDKLVKQHDMLEEIIGQLVKHETELNKGSAVSERYYGILKEHRKEVNSIESSSAATNLPVPEDIGVYKKQMESFEEENNILRRSLDDLAGGHLVLKNPQSEETSDKTSISSKLNGMNVETLKSKLMKSLKATKVASARLEESEREKAEIMSLLNESNQRNRIEIVNTVPPIPPSTTESKSESKADKMEKVKEKFEKLKLKLSKRDAECEQFKLLVQDMAEQIKALNENKNVEAKHDTCDRVQTLEKMLQEEKLKSVSMKRNSNSKSEAIWMSLSKVRTGLVEERRSISGMKASIQTQLAATQKEISQMGQSLSLRLSKNQNALSGIVLKYEKEFKERKRLFNLVQELRGNIRVLCRSRPSLDFEKSEITVKFPSDDTIELANSKGREKKWEFDTVFNPSKTNSQVFAQISDLCTSIIDGYNVCIFAYGQTGSGKTYTMEGSPQDRGVNFRALERLFSEMKQKNADGEWEFQVKVSLLEIYNEQILDLLTDKKSSKKLEVKKGEHGMHVPGLTMVAVSGHEQVEKLMSLGQKNRSVACTDMNSRSSRSHCMLSTYLEAKNLITGEVTRGKMHLIDLAGSERVSKSGVKGAQLTEATSINKSLSALGDVIQARANKQNHVPYRNSILTYLLQDSLQGDSKTVMFVQVSPVMTNAEESFCSLNFASRVRTVELGKASKHVEK